MENFLYIHFKKTAQFILIGIGNSQNSDLFNSVTKMNALLFELDQPHVNKYWAILFTVGMRFSSVIVSAHGVMGHWIDPFELFLISSSAP